MDRHTDRQQMERQTDKIKKVEGKLMDTAGSMAWSRTAVYMIHCLP